MEDRRRGKNNFQLVNSAKPAQQQRDAPQRAFYPKLCQLFDGRCFEYEQPADIFDAYPHGYDLGNCIAILSSQKTTLES